jgi:tetratricopeptide (TPR) repeat protein
MDILEILPISSDPFSVGVQLGAIVEYIDKLQLPDNVTTRAFCDVVVKKITKQSQCSLAEYFKAMKPSALGKPVGFISHAWNYNFRALITALVSYFGKDSYVWLDFVCNNQHKAIDYPFEWWSGTFKTAISSIGKTVMVLAPWNNPIPLTRGWCIWELYCTIESKGCEFDIAMTEESERAFVDDIDRDPEGTINKMLATIDCANSKCTDEEDKHNIHTAIQTIGFPEINKRIFEALRGWVIRRYSKELEKRRRELGEEHELFLKALNGLALLYDNQGDYCNALPLHEECLKKRKALGGENHRDYLTSLNNLAVSYTKGGRYGESLPLLIECLDKRRSVLEENHPSTLTSLNNLATVYKLCEYEKALPLHEECLERRSVLGENHPDYLSALNNLGTSYKRQCQYETALSLLTKCLKKRKSVLTENHPDTLVSLHNLAGVYDSQGHYNQALPLYTECYRMRKSILGDTHPDTLTTLNSLGLLRKNKRHYGKALQLLEGCWRKRTAVLGNTHPNTLATLNNLAGVYYNQCDFGKALALYEDCLKKSKTVLGETHRFTLTVVNNIETLHRNRACLKKTE